ncbi:MAG: WD40 repeat domain-containing protein [Chloroflexota bacterium]|nr:WD40 repeat domain-containing protein [Chloroflexota bacterium]
MSAPYRLIGVLLGLISIGLGILGARSETIGLQPCGSLDVSLRLSGCLRTVDGYRAALSPDGSMLAVAGMTAPAVELRRVADGALLSTLTTGQASSLEFAPDGQTLVVGTLDEAQLWRVAGGALLHALPHTELQRAERVFDVAFSPDGTILATATTADPPMMPSPPISTALPVRLWRVTDGALLHALDGHRLGTDQVRFAPDGASLAAVLGDGTLVAWDTTTWAPRFCLIDPAFSVQDVDFAPDGQTLVAASGRLTLRILRTSDGTVLQELEGDVAAFSPDGRVLATANGAPRLWQVPDGTELHRLRGHKFDVEDVAFSPDGEWLATAGGFEGTVRVWRVADGALLRMIEVPGGRVIGAEFLADGRTLVSRQEDWGRGQVRLWSPDVTVANLPKWLGVAAWIGVGLTTLWFGLPPTRRSARPWRWASGILLIGGSFAVWGPLWLLEGDATNGVAIFFGAFFTFTTGLGQLARSYRLRLRPWRREYFRTTGRRDRE